MTGAAPGRDDGEFPADPQRSGASDFSIAKLAFYALGAGVLVLVVSVPIIVLCAHWSPIAGLVAALVAVAAMIAAIGTVANRMVDRARAGLLAERAGQVRGPRPPLNGPE
ncbi:hypothetical protein [Gordonia sp. 'Campus']|uniref:hypothetical protein n=1 Tax=Gordonia sp. 'Campus' TaxID=2915824 RepID=UPI001EE4B65B|nr:hypothetical protein [Gordonia sp. 'Campus']